MPPYTTHKKTYCECCENRNICKPPKISIKVLAQHPHFIDWDDEKTSRGISGKSCDAVYTTSNDDVFFIEFKNIAWFALNQEQKDKIAQELTEKFNKSHDLYFKDGNIINTHEYICAYNTNTNDNIIKQLSSINFQERNLILNMYEFLNTLNISLLPCQDAFYYVTSR